MSVSYCCNTGKSIWNYFSLGVQIVLCFWKWAVKDMAQIIMLSWYVYKIQMCFVILSDLFLFELKMRHYEKIHIFLRESHSLSRFLGIVKKMVCCQSFYKIYSEMAQRLRFPDQLVFRPRAKLEHMGPHSSVTHKLLWQSSALSSSYPKPFQLCKSNRKPANTNQSYVL